MIILKSYCPFTRLLANGQIAYNKEKVKSNRTFNHDKNNNLLGIDYSFDAKLDRLIEKATKGRVKCGFIKYSGNVTVFDRYYYYINRHDDFLRSKLIPKIVNIITKVFKKVF